MSQNQETDRNGSAARPGRDFTLKYHHKAPNPRYNYGLDQEEREIIRGNEHLSKQEIWELLEMKRFSELKKAAVNLTGELMVKQRCPKCTLMPPCAHYASAAKLVNDAQRVMGSPKFKDAISPNKRSNLIKMVKTQGNGAFDDSMMQGENQYYIDTLQGIDDGNTISINKAPAAAFHERSQM